MFFWAVTKGNYFCEFLFTSLDGMTHLKSGLLISKKFAPNALGANSVF